MTVGKLGRAEIVGQTFGENAQRVIEKCTHTGKCLWKNRTWKTKLIKINLIFRNSVKNTDSFEDFVLDIEI